MKYFLENRNIRHVIRTLQEMKQSLSTDTQGKKNRVKRKEYRKVVTMLR